MSVYLYFHDAFQEISESGSQNFETLNYTIPNDPNNILIDDTFDPDLNFVSKKVNVYVSPEDFHDSFKKPETSYFSIRHLNTWNIKKNFVSLKRFLRSLDFTFSRIFFQRLGVVTWITLCMICQIMQVPHKKGVIAEMREGLSTFMILSISKQSLRFLLTVDRYCIGNYIWENT